MQIHKLPSWKNKKPARHLHEMLNGGILPERLDRMQAVMKGYIDRGWAPGMVTLVNHRGHEFVETFGNMDFDSNVPMKRDTIFRLASNTKPITAVAVMILIEECRLRLDDSVEEWLPELKNRKVVRSLSGPLDDTVPAKRAITVRDLLTFRSGYGEVAFNDPTCPLQKAMMEKELPLSKWIFPGTPDEFMKRLSDLPLAEQPGERWRYHLSLDILGVLISRVTGKSLGDFMRERIFDPLEMKDTGFYVPQEKMHRLPTCYATDFSTGKLIVTDPAEGGQMSKQPLFESGAGGLVSTVDDMATFGLMMLHKGSYHGERILSRPSVELMTRDHLTAEQKSVSPFFENFWNNRGWGLGIGVITDYGELGEVPGRYGWDGAFGSSMYVDPAEQLVGVLMVQRSPDKLQLPKLTRDFWTSVYQLIGQ